MTAPGSGERDLSAVGVPEQERGFPDRSKYRSYVCAFIGKAVPLRRVGVPPAAARNGVDGETILEQRLHEFPVRRVVAEATVDEHQRWPFAVPVIRDRSRGRTEAMHGVLQRVRRFL